VNSAAAQTVRHPQATTTLVLGISSVLFPILGPFVWYYGQRMLIDIDKSPFRVDGRGAIAAGRTLGACVTMLCLVVPLVVFLLAVL
jgi:hypothetical protein